MARQAASTSRRTMGAVPVTMLVQQYSVPMKSAKHVMGEISRLSKEIGWASEVRIFRAGKGLWCAQIGDDVSADKTPALAAIAAVSRLRSDEASWLVGSASALALGHGNIEAVASDFDNLCKSELVISLLAELARADGIE